MTQAELIHHMAINRADNMTPEELFIMCQSLNEHTSMPYIVEALEIYLNDDIDEVDYNKVAAIMEGM